MKLKELNSEQRLQLKQDILTRRMDEKGESPSYGELADADRLVSDQELARLSTFDLGFNFFHRDNLQNAACGVELMRLCPRKAV